MKTKSNYSFTTSKPAQLENEQISKQKQCDLVFGIARKGANNLLQISQVAGIPQAIVSARISDLISEGRVKYSGHVVYENRLRKRIVAVAVATKREKVSQKELF